MYYPCTVSAELERGLENVYKPFECLCGARMGFAERLLAFDSLWTGLVIVTSNVYGVLV